MNLTQLLELSGHFADELASPAAVQPQPAPPSVQAALDESRLALEHWRSVRTPLQHESLPSALAVQLEQIDSLTRSAADAAAILRRPVRVLGALQVRPIAA